MKKIKLIIIEDHTMVREMWKMVFSMEDDFTVIGDCGTFYDAVELIKKEKADVILLDINLSSDSGFDLIPEILTHSKGTKILTVSMHNLTSYAKKAIHLGAHGYVTKNSSNRELIEAIRKVKRGKKYLCNEVINLLKEEHLNTETKGQGINALSKREIEIIELLKEGKSSKVIGKFLNISSRTVEVHRYKILHKLGLKNTAALINFISKTEIGI
ncbi:MAG TPA: response regulator transcription factor [Chitinophagaceae bacterium]|nr:response regulator transcription factor [Chitinophagaceae bacterium]